MRIGWPAEDEQTLSAVVEGDSDRDQRTLAGRENSTLRAERDVARDVGRGKPLEIALVAGLRNDAREADVGSVALTVEMPNDAH